MTATAHLTPVAGDEPAGRAAPAGPRLAWVDVSKGVGILLVVLGHAIGGLVAGHLLPEQGTAATIFYLIYSFHMPLFFFLSGFFVPRRVARNPTGFARGLLTSILYPYLVWSFIQVTILYLASNYTNADRPSLDYASILWAPPSQFWFLYVLGLYHLLALPLAARRSGQIALLGLGVAGFALQARLPLPAAIFAQLVHYLVFYALGVVCGRHGAAVGTVLTRHAYALGAIAAALWAAAVWIGLHNGVAYDSTLLLPAAIGGSIAIMALATRVGGRLEGLLQMLGHRAMAIYVAHVLFVAGTRILLVKLFALTDAALLLPVVVIAGVAGPLALYAGAARLGATGWLGLGTAPRRAAHHG